MSERKESCSMDETELSCSSFSPSESEWWSERTAIESEEDSESNKPQESKVYPEFISKWIKEVEEKSAPKGKTALTPNEEEFKKITMTLQQLQEDSDLCPENEDSNPSTRRSLFDDNSSQTQESSNEDQLHTSAELSSCYEKKLSIGEPKDDDKEEEQIFHNSVHYEESAPVLLKSDATTQTSFGENIPQASSQEKLGERNRKLFEENMKLQEKLLLMEDSLKTVSHKYNQEYQERRIAFNKLQELRGNIRVCCRVRPIVEGDAEDSKIDYLSDEKMRIASKTFSFDRVYKPHENQETVFKDVQPLVVSTLDGYNVCIMAYGQTGSGKTYTMEGTSSNPGINVRALQELFRLCKERSSANSFEFYLTCSVFEIYNEQIKDLLVPSSSATPLEVRQGPEGVYIENLTQQTISSIDDATVIINYGKSNRAVGDTEANQHSSRSHCIIMIQVTARNLITHEKTLAKLYLVDLAGSERVSKTQASGGRLIEAKYINKSLSSLGNVISALLSKQNHIPYRDSKLTYLLQDAFVQHSKCMMLIQISPSQRNESETLCSLQFGKRVQQVELGSAKRNIIESQEMAKQNEKIRKLNLTLRSKEETLHVLKQKLKQSVDKSAKLEKESKFTIEKYRKSEKELREKLKKKHEELTQLQKQLEKHTLRPEFKENIDSSNHPIARSPYPKTNSLKKSKTKSAMTPISKASPLRSVDRMTSSPMKRKTNRPITPPPPYHAKHQKISVVRTLEASFDTHQWI